MKTRDRILLKSLSLFNEQGERLVTTNHIAAALNMSPGNLYYHFANKDAIIFELFGQYVRQMQEMLILPEDRPISQPDKIALFEASDDDVDALIINIWIVATSWSNFLASTGFFGYDGTLTEDLMRRGIYQVICLEAPYLRGAAAIGLADLKASYSSGLRG